MTKKEMTQKEQDDFEKVLKKKDIKYLQELLNQNDSQIQSHTDSITQMKNCNSIIKKILANKKREAICHKIETNTQFYLDSVLPQMEHTEGCRVGKPYDCDELFRGVMRYRADDYVVVCPKCALEHIVENPWCGVDVNITVDFDFDNY